jgi:hypothetical protein
MKSKVWKFLSSPDSALSRNSFIRNALYQLTSGSAKVLMFRVSTFKFNCILVASTHFFFRLHNFLLDNIQTCPFCLKDLGSIVGIVIKPQVGWSVVQIPVWARDLSPPKRSWPVLWPNEPPRSMGTRVLSWGLRGQNTKFTTHLLLVPRLRMSGPIPSLPPYTSSWHGQQKLYLVPVIVVYETVSPQL